MEQNDEAERLADRHRNVLAGVDSGRNGNGELCDVAVSLIRATEPFLRTQAALIAELEADLQTVCQREADTIRRYDARAEAAEAGRDLWKLSYRCVAGDLNLVVPELDTAKARVVELEAAMAAAKAGWQAFKDAHTVTDHWASVDALDLALNPPADLCVSARSRPDQETPADARAALIRTQAARIAELEEANRGLVRLNEATQARAEAAEKALDEMTRRRDEWRKKAEGYDAVRLALREKVGTPWPPNMSRLLWAGIAADEKKRADDAEAEVARLREALGDAMRRLGGGCDANNGGDHTVITQGKYKFCSGCGETLFGIRYCHAPRVALQPKEKDARE